MMDMITGKTRVVGVIGWPVDHSLSPPMHNGEFERLGLDYVYVAWPVNPADIPDAVRGLRTLGVAGFNATIPHKQAIMPLLDEVSPEAAAIGAVNTVDIRDGRMVGYNTDVPGWTSDIEQDVALAGKSVCVMGAGGASRAVCVGACQAGARRLVLWDMRDEATNALAADLGARFASVLIEPRRFEPEPCRRLLRECDIVVNATPIGMHATPGMPVPADWLRPGQYVYDVIYTPAETELLAAARQLGCRRRNGLGMLARQGAIAFKTWTGIAPDARRMEETLRQVLASR